jgi:hypothetical protein
MKQFNTIALLLLFMTGCGLQPWFPTTEALDPNKSPPKAFIIDVSEIRSTPGKKPDVLDFKARNSHPSRKIKCSVTWTVLQPNGSYEKVFNDQVLGSNETKLLDSVYFWDGRDQYFLKNVSADWQQ